MIMLTDKKIETSLKLRELKKSRKKPVPGDIFTFYIEDHGYFFGRVIRDDVRLFFSATSNWLIYVYKYCSEDKIVDVEKELIVENLLLAPLIINKLGWTRGFFENISFQELRTCDVLDRHVFFSASRRIYVDERGKEVPKLKNSPCSIFALFGYATIPYQVEKELYPENFKYPEDFKDF